MTWRGGATGSLRRHWLPVVIACLLAAGPGIGAAASTAVQLVVDCSIGTWRTLDDGTSALVATRIAINELAATLGNRGKERIGVRLMGSRQPFTAADACQDTALALPPGAASALAAAAVLDGVAPRGRRPLLAAVAAAAGDLGDASSGRRIVLVATGQDDCGGDRSAAAAALRSGVELRVVGVGLDAASLASFQAVAPARNAASTAELAAALRWAVLGEEDSPAAAEFTLQVMRDDALVTGATATLRSAVTRQDYPMTVDGDGFRARVPPGQYALAVTAADGSRLAERNGIILAAGAHPVQTVEIADQPAPTLEAKGGPWTAGDSLEVRFAGAPAGRHWVELVGAAAPAEAWMARAAAEGETGAVRLPLPPQPLTLELRLSQVLADGVLEPLAVTPLQVQAPRAELQLPATVPPSQPLTIGWQGPAQDGDEIAIAAVGAPPLERLVEAPVTGTDPVTVTAPAKEGAYEVRYLSGVSGTILAHAALAVAPIPITLQVPDQVGAGREFTVSATPTPPADGLLILALPEAAPQEYLLWRPAAATVSMAAPRRPGRYEVRYVGSSGDAILARTTVEVVAVAASLEAPKKVPAGSRFKVSWTGPDGPEDFIDVAPENASRLRHLDWAYTAQGSPVDLAAPFKPGTYEVRYISGDGLTILARRPLTVE